MNGTEMKTEHNLQLKWLYITLYNNVVLSYIISVASVTQAPWGGSTLSPSTLPGETNALHLLAAREALPQIRVETMFGTQANYEMKIKITIYFYKIISYEKYSTLNLKKCI